MTTPQNIPYGTPPQHPQVANLQADAGVAPPLPAQAYGPYSSSPQKQPQYSPGPHSSHTPSGPSPAPSPYQQQQQYNEQRTQHYGPYSTSPATRPGYNSQGSGYFPSPAQPQPQQSPYGSSAETYTNGASNLHPSYAADGGYTPQRSRHNRQGSHSSSASHHSHRSHNDRRMSQGAYSQDHPSPALQARRASYANDSRNAHRGKSKDDYSDDDSVFSSSSEDEHDHSGARRHSYGGNRSAYSHSARKRRGSHRSEAEIQADKDAIDRRPTLGDSVVLMYDTLKGALTGRRS